MHFCGISMQIGNYRAYATIPRTEFSKMSKTCEKILQKPKLSCTGISRVLLIYVGLTVDLMIWSSLFFAVFVFWFIFSAIVEVFCYFWDRSILWVNSPPIPGRTGDLLSTNFRNFCVFFFQSIICQRTGSLLKEEFFDIGIPHARTFTVLTKSVTRRVTLEQFCKFKLIHSWNSDE